MTNDEKRRAPWVCPRCDSPNTETARPFVWKCLGCRHTWENREGLEPGSLADVFTREAS